MKVVRIASIVSLLATLGCVVPTAGGAVAVMPPGAIVPVPAHLHSLQCAHFWGYYAGRPVYYVEGQYLYWDENRWIALAQLPGHGTHHHYLIEHPVVPTTAVP